MKFKATLTDYGVALLERRFVPAFEKIGKTCHLYLTPRHFILLHNVLNVNGVQAIAQFTKETIFDEYMISSQNDNCIAITVDLGLLSRALKSSANMDGDQLVVKLVKKGSSISHNRLPYLTFESKGFRSAIVQDVPISQPLNRDEVADIQAALDLAQTLPQTLVQVPDIVKLQALVDRLKNVGEQLDVGVTQYGDLHLNVSTSSVKIGSEFRKLRVVGVRADETGVDPDTNSSTRLQRAIQISEASMVRVKVKHFAKSLQCNLTKPDGSFCGKFLKCISLFVPCKQIMYPGISPNNGCLLMMFQYFVPGTRQTDNSLSLHYRLPVIIDEN